MPSCLSYTSRKAVLVCDSQPMAVEGIRSVLRDCADLAFAGSVSSLEAALELARAVSPGAVLVDRNFGPAAVSEWLRRLGGCGSETAAIIWGSGITEPEALKFLQAGAKGILLRTADTETLLTCLRSIMEGNTWMEDGIFENFSSGGRLQPRRSHLTVREAEIAELVEKGLRNRDIAGMLGIQPGTVKIHLKHIFEKTGVRGRYGLALTSLRQKGAVGLPAM